MKHAQLIFGLLTITLSTGPAFASGHGEGGTSPQKAFKMLQEGNKRFISGEFDHAEKVSEKRRRELASGQQPHTILLSCSDSRVSPEIVFDQGLGEVFPIRVAGNVVTSAGIASIEYALEHLGAKLLVVMGHESCGAVKAALNTPVGKTAGSVNLDLLLSDMRPYLKESSRHIAADDKKLRAPAMANVNGVVCKLLSRSKIIRQRFEKGELMIKSSIYSLESGKADFWDSSKYCP